jgi:hypothetical protein
LPTEGKPIRATRPSPDLFFIIYDFFLHGYFKRIICININMGGV